MPVPDSLRYTKFPLANGSAAIPALGFGTLIPDPLATKQATRAALEVGFRHFDCAERYRNEEAVGEAMHEVFSAGTIRREDVFVTTKLWNNNHRPDRVKPAFEASRRRLRLDYVDCYLIHTPFAFRPGDEQDPRDEHGVTLLETWQARDRPRRSTRPFIGDVLRPSERGSTRSLINGFSGSSVVGSISKPKSSSALEGGERLFSLGPCREQAVRDSRGQGWIIRRADAARGRRILMPLPVMLLLLLALVAPARAGEHITRIGGLAVTIWTPDDMTTQPAPIVVFSHGFHGCATQSRFLMEALAADGYLVFAPNHRDAACNGGAARWTDRPEAPLVRPAIWDDGTYRDRADDITGLLAALYKDSAFAGRIDWQRVALVGHSLGGYTVLGLGGAWRSWRLPGVKAVVTGADFPDLDEELIEGGEAASSMRDLAWNVMARKKVLYDGHAVAAGDRQRGDRRRDHRLADTGAGA